MDSHQHQPEPPVDADSAAPDDDPLHAVRTALDGVLELPLPARAEVFEEAHRVVVGELRALELG